MRGYKRSARVAELLQQEISKIMLELQERGGMGFVTITGVKLSDDLQNARVFYSVIGTDDEIANSHKILKESLSEIRHMVAIRLNLRRTPVINFEYDETPQKASRVFEILEKIKIEEPPAEE